MARRQRLTNLTAVRRTFETCTDTHTHTQRTAVVFNVGDAQRDGHGMECVDGWMDGWKVKKEAEGGRVGTSAAEIARSDCH